MFRSRFIRRGLAVAAARAACALAAPAMARRARPPDELVKRVADDVLKIVAAGPELRAGSQPGWRELIEEKIVPHFDFQRMTRLAVGRSWRQATPEQQKRLVEEFRKLLVRSYSTAYSAYRQIGVEVKPLQAAAADDDVQVRTHDQASRRRPRRGRGLQHVQGLTPAGRCTTSPSTG